MKILFVAAEVAPFAMTGGLADMTSSLARALKRSGHDVRIALPCYRSVPRNEVSPAPSPVRVEVPVAGLLKRGKVNLTHLGDIPVYLIENAAYFGRAGLYGDDAGDYPDNAARFAFFCRAVLQMLHRIDFRPDVIHCHDWQTALIPYLLRYAPEQVPEQARCATVFTIHNLAYHGLFPKERLRDLGIDSSHFVMERLEYYDRVNLLKGGIIGSHSITTVSPRYAAEILTPTFGCGLEGVLRQRVASLTGILNGIDYDEWNPATDRLLASPFTPSSLSGKAVQKQALLKDLGLAPSTTAPLIGMVTRLVEQKGIDLLLEILPWLLGQDVRLALLGTGSRSCQAPLEAAVSESGGKIALVTQFNPALSHQIFAGSDIYLMPSRFEPCGIGQMIAMRYGTVPIVRRTGGLADTVIDSSDDPAGSTGFVFDDYSAGAFREAVARACAAHAVPSLWKTLVCRCMRADFSWRESSRQYDAVYRQALDARRSA